MCPPIYVVEREGKPTDLVRAANAAAALRHVVRNTLKVTRASQDDLAELIGGGMRVQQAANGEDKEADVQQ